VEDDKRVSETEKDRGEKKLNLPIQLHPPNSLPLPFLVRSWLEGDMETQRIDRKRKLDHEQDSAAVGLSLCELFDQRITESADGWNVLHPILEHDVLQAKIPSTEVALSHLVKWFRTIARDAEKLRLFRQWVIPSSDLVKQELVERVECTSSPVSTSSVSSSSSPSSTHSASSLSAILNENTIHEDLEHAQSPDTSNNASTGTFTPEFTTHSKTANGGQQQVLLKQLLQQQQQQIVLLQHLQKQTPSQDNTAAKLTSIGVFPRMGSPNTLLTATLKGGSWHAPSSKCTCALGFTTSGGITTTAQRIPGGAERDMLFIVPQINTSTASPTRSIPMVVHLTLCTSPDEPIVSLEQFLYTPRERSLGCSASDEDSEGTGEGSVSGEDDASPPPQALPPLDIATTVCPTPKQMMTIRERMMEHIQQENGNHRNSTARLTILQQPTVLVVWKNRRLDIPFKLKVECLEDPTSNGSAFSVHTPSKLFLLAVVTDHKGRLQMDAAEHVAEELSPQGIAHFSNLRMTKGTWGKEWTITFAAVVKASLNNPVIAGVSTACPIVVKTRKNPQVRHNSGGRAASTSPPPVSFVDRKTTATPVRAKRHRVEDLLDHRPPSPPPRTPSHSEDMASLLAAAELKQQEQSLQGDDQQEEPTNADLPLISKQNESEFSFTTFQNLMNYLEDIRTKRQISLGVLEQPQPKRDSKVLIVKKGKPFRVPFQVQLRSTAIRHNPQHYVCVAVVRTDKGEEVAVRNSEVPFDWRGIACFAGLMVMKGTWGKTVQLTFEARWAAKGRGVAELPPSWTTQRMLVVSETSPTQLMCYTKDKKSPGAP
jgi:hypothetical protein